MALACVCHVDNPIEHKKYLNVLRHRRAKIGKVFCSTAVFIGAPFGSIFELQDDGKTLKRCARCVHNVPLAGSLSVVAP